MTDARTRMTPGPDHPITVERWTGHVTVQSGPVVLAETDRALELQEAAYPVVFYVPLEDVDRQLLRPSEHHTWCPYKGEASYFDVIDTGAQDLSAAVWYYDDPFPAVAGIRDHVAFYTDRVSVTATSHDSTVL